MRSMGVALDAEAALDIRKVVGFHFPDTGESWTIEVRRGIADVREGLPESPDLRLAVDSVVWREMLCGRRNPATTLASDAVQVEGGVLELLGFLRLFRR